MKRVLAYLIHGFLVFGWIQTGSNLLFAQVDIKIKNSSEALRSEDDLWAFTLTSKNTLAQSTDIVLTVYDEEEKVLYRARSNSYRLEPGVSHNINRATLDHIKTETPIKEATDKYEKTASGFLAPGNYSHCVSIFLQGTEIEIGRDCEVVTVKPEPVDSGAIKAPKKTVLKQLIPHGSLELFSYTDYKPTVNGPAFNNRSAGFHLSPQLNVLGVPLNGSFYYDTDTGFYYTTNPQIQLQLDAGKFQELLKQRLSDFVNNKCNLATDQYTKYLSLAKEYDQVRQIIQNPSFNQDVLPIDLKKYTEQLQTVADNAQEKLKSLLPKVDSLKSLIMQCETLSSPKFPGLQNEYNKILVSKDSLKVNGMQEKLGNIFSGADSIQGLISQNEIFDSSKYKAPFHHYDSLLMSKDSSLICKAQEKLQNLLPNADSIKILSLKVKILDSTKCEQLQRNYNKLMAVKDSIQRTVEKVSIAIEKAKGYLKVIEQKDKLDSLLMSDSTFAKVKEHYEYVKNFDVTSLENPQLIVSELKKSGKISGIEEILAHFKQLEIGSAVPAWSEFSVSGITLNGLNAAYEIKGSTLMIVGGKVRTNSFYYNPTLPPDMESHLLAGGYSKKISTDGSYSVLLVHADFPQNDSASLTHALEKNNALVGRLEYSIADEKITAEFEGALSFAKFDDVTPGNEGTQIQSPFAWISQTLLQKDDPENGSFSDLAVKVGFKAKLFHDKTSLLLNTRYIGANFYTPGNPYIINDRFSNEVGVEQTLFKDRIRCLASLIRNEDNLAATKGVTTSFYTSKLSLSLNFPKLPMLSVLYQPNVILNDYQQVQVNSFSITSTYRYLIAKLPSSFTLSVMDMSTISAAETSQPFQFRYITAMQSLLIKGKDFQMSYTHTINVNDTISIRYHSLNASVGWKAFKLIDLNTGFELSKIGEVGIQLGGHFDGSATLFKIMTVKASIYSLPTQTLTYRYLYGYNPKATAYLTTTFQF